MESIAAASTPPPAGSQSAAGSGPPAEQPAGDGRPIKRISRSSPTASSRHEVAGLNLLRQPARGPPGAGAVYLHAHHPDITRSWTPALSIERRSRIQDPLTQASSSRTSQRLARNNVTSSAPTTSSASTACPSRTSTSLVPRDGGRRAHQKKINARTFRPWPRSSSESGYPYVMFEGTVNKANPIKGKVVMSNLCSGGPQVSEPAGCNEGLTTPTWAGHLRNLGSLIAKTMDSRTSPARSRTAVRRLCRQRPDPAQRASIDREQPWSLTPRGLGQMNLHGFLARERIPTAPRRAWTSPTSTSPACCSPP